MAKNALIFTEDCFIFRETKLKYVDNVNRQRKKFKIIQSCFNI